ncbi:hypothetical protein B0H15DRAFT_798934 [Mycena belliarum]|uniref:Uncharacterized protein n=1 Tax=Mycena belliarum TaxID=1033014 RepID=A0AAD6XT70_9AGAR|nr:hypothetical protein B0H15DRAFT_798934 [Mycena belliae]
MLILITTDTDPFRFQRLAIPYLYRRPAFSERNFKGFSNAISANPSLGKHIREIDDTFASIIPHACNLTHLVAGGHQHLSWTTFLAIAQTAGATLEEFMGFETPAQPTPPSSAIFAQFTALRSFEWYYQCNRLRSAASRGLFDVVENVSAGAFPRLESLAVTPCECLSVFSKMLLPSLRHVVISYVDAEALDFLEAHGAKIRHLEVRHTGTDPVLPLCPNTETYTCHISMNHPGQELLGHYFEDGFENANLRKIIMSNLITPERYGHRQEEKRWAAFFSALAASEQLPALREINLRKFYWPTSAHEIAKCAWAGWAEMLLEHGIKMTDRAGIEWRTRLKGSHR